MQNHKAEIIWRADEVPVSVRFDDPFFSLENGLEETRHVFLSGNGLPGRFRDGFHVAELGFGTGLNFLTTLHSWRASGQKGVLCFTSFEAHPLSAHDMRKALGAFGELRAVSEALCNVWTPQGGELDVAPDVSLKVVIGDARETVPKWNGHADAWFLDGFSPAKNPELWSEDLMTAVGAHTLAGGTFATYTAAGHVRRALSAAGFAVERVAGYGRKRHMSRGVFRL